MSAFRRAGAVAAAALVASGCMTLTTLSDSSYPGPHIYSGVRSSFENLGEFGRVGDQFFVLASLVDLPLCLVADTLLLPVTIPLDARRAAARVEPPRTDRDVPSPWRSEGGDPLVDARRLFRSCAALLGHRAPGFTDCYAIDARIRLTGVRAEPLELSGADYKAPLRVALAGLEGDADAFVAVRDPSFTVEGERVRIDATWVASYLDERRPVSWLVARGSDGYWRIVEEVSPGWPKAAAPE